MGLEQRKERQDRPRRHHERGRPQGEGHRRASPPTETPRYHTRIPPGSKARLHPGITQANDTRSLQTHIFLSMSPKRRAEPLEAMPALACAELPPGDPGGE